MEEIKWFKVEHEIFAKGTIRHITSDRCIPYWKSCRLDPCVYCGKLSETNEHIVPASQGGKAGWKNCVRACMGCNQKRGSMGLLLFLVNEFANAQNNRGMGPQEQLHSDQRRDGAI